MKNTYLYLAILIVLATITYFLVTRDATTTLDVEESDFAVENIDKIHKIFIADKNNQTAMISRKDGYWEYTNKVGKTYKARPAAVEVLLQTMQQIEIRYMVQNAAVKSAVDDLATNGKKVELYDRQGKRFKTYYVGGPSNDMQGTFMIMEGSDNPYVTHIQSWDGVLSDRFLLAEKDWRDKTIFGYRSENIKTVQIDYPKQQSNSFVLTQVKDEEFEVEPLYPSTTKIDKPVINQKALAYLYKYEKLIAEAFENKNPNRAEISEKLPFATVQITTKDGEQKTVKFIPVIEQVEEIQENVKSRPKVQRYFAFVNGNEDVYLVQQLLFGEIFWGYDFFFEK
ncbi:MAG: DUF4340 domain-containing protein [Saprospiraceae bacterium]